MDYNLDSLGTRNFEHLSQSLAGKVLGPRVGVFGDGPDGGREATWRGQAVSLGKLENWDGYGVVQAKYKVHPGDAASNLGWAKTAFSKEISDWAKPNSKRLEKPEFLLFVTNVRMSSVPKSGKDAIYAHVKQAIDDSGLPIRDFRVWDYWDLLALLDDAVDIRRRYAAFVTPGDVISNLVDQAGEVDKILGEAMSSYVARTLRDERLVNLTQGGSVSDDPVTIGDIFVDLPCELPLQSWLDAPAPDNDSTLEVAGQPEDSPEFEDIISDFSLENELERSGITRHLVNDFNHIPAAAAGDAAHPHKTVLVGGPGQGKSTITQWLAQLYRVEFLRGSTIAETAETSTLMKKIDDRREQLDLPTVNARRWPFRLILTELADYLAGNPDASLLHYVGHVVTKRGSAECGPDAMRRWLRSYPWLLLIDGLDEVPASSNRAQVMGVIRDFFVDVAAIGGDVAAVATTRPQGYGEEFSRREYRHFHLSSLETEEALEYADGLVAIRCGAGTPSAAKVMERLRRATDEEHTRSLFESPLQVTILAVLLEKLGKAPGDRSRLFSAYYNVISQREQEKSGALSDLLQRFESDIDHLHRRVGYLLQSRSSEVGEASSSLSIQEFNTLIVERFEVQGYAPNEVVELAKQFEELVIDRLVFLAKLQADRVGFELRSLQEFMASEWIINSPEAKVIPTLLGHANSSYWRNVVLFAIGTIFAKKEHLRAEVVLMCEELNSESSVSGVLQPGSELALDVLRDGSCAAMPVYSRSLTEKALLMLRYPRGRRIGALLFLKNTDGAPLLWKELESTGTSPMSVWLNRAFLLSAMAGESDRASAALDRLVEHAGVELRRQLVLLAWDTRDRHLARAVAGAVETCEPKDVLVGRRSSRRRVYQSRRLESKWPEWIRHCATLTDERTFAELEPDEDDPTLSATIVLLGQDRDAWRWLQQMAGGHPGWRVMQRLADFALQPTAGALADALAEAALSDDEPVLPSRAPWVYAACVRSAVKQFAIDNDSGAMRSRISDLARAARSGFLGDFDDWNAAQERWGDSLKADSLFFDAVRDSQHGLPVWPELRHSGVPISAFSFRLSLSAGAQGDLVKVASDLVGRSRGFDTIPYFVASSIYRWESSSEPPAEFDAEVGVLHRHLVEQVKACAPQTRWWISWLALGPIDSVKGPDDATLSILGTAPTIVGELERADAENLVERAREAAGDAFPIVRLALASSPGVFHAMSEGEIRALLAGGEPEQRAPLEAAVDLMHADPDELWRGKFDHLFRMVASRGRDVIGARWLAQLLQQSPEQTRLTVAARGVVALEETDPDVAERYYDIARGAAKVSSSPGPS